MKCPDKDRVYVGYEIEGELEFDEGQSREAVNFAKALFEDVTRPDDGCELC